MSAFDTYDNDVLVPAFQEVFEAPAFAEGGVLVAKKVVTVKKVHDRIVLVPFGIAFGEIDVQASRLVRRCKVYVSFYDHEMFESFLL
jgi:hypothetical protein